MAVYVVTLLYVGQDVIILGWHALAFQFIITTLGSNFGTCGDENLQFRVRKHCSADIPSVHDNTLFFTHGLLLAYHGGAHESQRGDRAHVVGHFEGSYFSFHQFSVEVSVWHASFSVQFKRNIDISHFRLQPVCVDRATMDNSVAHGVEGDSAVHGTSVNVNISDTASQVFGHSAFAAGRVSVYGYRYFFHVVYGYDNIIMYKPR